MQGQQEKGDVTHNRKLTTKRQEEHNGVGMETYCLGRKGHTRNTEWSVPTEKK